MAGVARPMAARFAANVMPEPNSGCLLWLGRVNRYGYGQISVGKFGKAETHRVAYELAHGPVPTGLVLDHKCRVRSCVNSAHLEAVTSRENTLRGESFAAKNARKTHCKRGHLLTGTNVYFSSGGRQCRACVPFRRSKP